MNSNGRRFYEKPSMRKKKKEREANRRRLKWLTKATGELSASMSRGSLGEWQSPFCLLFLFPSRGDHLRMVAHAR